MHKIILDTNVILQHLTSRDLTFGKFIQKLVDSNEAELYVSSRILDELKSALQYPKIKQRLNGQSSRFLAWYKYSSKLVEVNQVVKFCRDKDDNKFLELAKQTGADYIITGDNDLLELAVFENTKIINPRSYYDSCGTNSIMKI
jgi:uncharacterized protein